MYYLRLFDKYNTINCNNGSFQVSTVSENITFICEGYYPLKNVIQVFINHQTTSQIFDNNEQHGKVLLTSDVLLSGYNFMMERFLSWSRGFSLCFQQCITILYPAFYGFSLFL